MNLKDIAATLAILGSGALVMSGCGKDKAPSEVPGGEAAAEEAAEGSCGGEKAEGEGEGSCGGEHAEGEEAAEGSCSAEGGEGEGGEGSCGGK